MFTLSGTALCAICGDHATGWSKGQLVCPKHGGGNGSVLTVSKIERERRKWEYQRLVQDLEKLRIEASEERREYHRRRKLELAKEIIASSRGVHRKINLRWLNSITTAQAGKGE